jgi:murein DD-endopeptidase MepM/ murein hydrolase activator NlpD
MTDAPLPTHSAPPPPTGFARVWADLAAAGWHEVILRLAAHALMLAMVGGVIGISRIPWNFDHVASKVQMEVAAPAAAAPEAGPAPALSSASPAFAPFIPDEPMLARRVDLHTLIPTRGRTGVITYTVQSGDTLFGIAERFNLKPETILWGNYFTLKDDPHLLRSSQTLNILPTDGTYHYVTEGNTLEQIAKFYNVTPQAIAEWPGNDLDPDQPQIAPNTYLIVPGGVRESQAWVLPTIPRAARVRSSASNFGQCPGGYTGILGSGAFVWPADNHSLSGYDYSAIHPGLDIRAGAGAPLYATDAGVVVYAGWNDWGYGNLVAIDHGNGWQSVYGHLSQWNVQCGQSVSQGELIGLAGSTGRSSGAHLHFELRYNGGYVNPWSVLP